MNQKPMKTAIVSDAFIKKDEARRQPDPVEILVLGAIFKYAPKNWWTKMLMKENRPVTPKNNICLENYARCALNSIYKQYKFIINTILVLSI